MTSVVLFHHAQGVTGGVRQFADQLRAAGHQVTVPDLYEGRVFATLDEGVAYGRRGPAHRAGAGLPRPRGRGRVRHPAS